MTWENVNWLIWSVCGLLWIYNAVVYRRTRRIEQLHYARMMQLERELNHALLAMVNKEKSRENHHYN